MCIKVCAFLHSMEDEMPWSDQFYSGTVTNVFGSGVGDGVTNNSSAFSGFTNPTIVGPGNYLISTNTTISQPLNFQPGARITVASGVTVTINAPVYANKYQRIFDGTGTVNGTFGSCALSIGWFGAVANANVATGAGTDNTAAINRALSARTRSNTVAHVVLVPAGRWLVSGTLTVTLGACFAGEAMDSSFLLVTTGATGNIVYLPNAEGPPTTVRDMMVSGFNGAAGATGIGCFANGAQLENLWVSGFHTCFLLASTGVFLRQFVAEHAAQGDQYGIRVTSDNTTISDGHVFETTTGIHVDQTLNSGAVTIIENVSIVQPLSYGVVQASGRLQMTSVTVSHVNGGRIDGAGFRITGAQMCEMHNCSAIQGGPTDSSFSVGVDILNSSSNVKIVGGTFNNFQHGIQVNTAGAPITLIGVHCLQNLQRGLNVIRAAYLNVNGGQFSYNGGSGASDAGIYLTVNNAYERHSITGVIAVQGGGGPQDYGIYAECNNANSKVLITGNVAAFNATANIQTAGSSVGNITNTNNMVG